MNRLFTSLVARIGAVIFPLIVLSCSQSNFSGSDRQGAEGRKLTECHASDPACQQQGQPSNPPCPGSNCTITGTPTAGSGPGVIPGQTPGSGPLNPIQNPTTPGTGIGSGGGSVGDQWLKNGCWSVGGPNQPSYAVLNETEAKTCAANVTTSCRAKGHSIQGYAARSNCAYKPGWTILPRGGTCVCIDKAEINAQTRELRYSETPVPY